MGTPEDIAGVVAFLTHAPEISRQTVDHMSGKVDEIGQAVRQRLLRDACAAGTHPLRLVRREALRIKEIRARDPRLSRPPTIEADVVLENVRGAR
jgi:hypothetical protein